MFLRTVVGVLGGQGWMSQEKLFVRAESRPFIYFTPTCSTIECLPGNLLMSSPKK